MRLQRSLNALLLWTTRLALLLSISMRPSCRVLVVVARQRRRFNGMGITRRHGAQHAGGPSVLGLGRSEQEQAGAEVAD
jgi:hypothetical protein